ncbi:MAG: ABC transporter substrate-binding protein [Peptococcaceae bacterium]|nr:ABC transporter substrate-binding protein [Peptococcaceae bacterium]
MKRYIKPKIAFWLLILVVACSANLILNKPEPPPPVKTLRVMESMRTPYYLPLYLAANLGYFAEEGLAVNITTTSQEAIRTALHEGRTDIALCGLQKILFTPGAKGPQPKIFAAIAGRDGSFLLSRQENGSFEWQNLNNKSIIGYSQDDSSEIALEEALRLYGQTPNRSVTIYYNISDNLRLGAFRAGTGDYIQLLEPAASQAEAQGFGQVAASVGMATGDMIVTACAVQPACIESNPDALQKFTNAIYKAQLWLHRHNSEEAAAIVAPLFDNLDYGILTNAIERYRSIGVWADSPVIASDSYNKFQAAAKKSGEIAVPISYETAVINDFARHAVETVVLINEEETRKKNFIQRMLK